ncbi:hypothetical protein DSM106972_037250 [Dulcicalothrix desertica PCC 7102]|uniref:Uncharacterized protein n=1 Tax=Dulcicalothrix desertica PCC 7102 TaxID=232991 RepID=A0A3S1CMH7_9CYAN|nr:hypothetical protein [Dulcicalothrix desertica]RUT05718.1 hypothetical protein DSM106972_037250 [Dulcicalothrix desertica PCC 7102]TWH39616.1 hypothetical protein CAL7102_08864 [Dulcicalothrix desertica PCC 7102]
MIKQSFFQPDTDTDTLLRLSQHTRQLTDSRMSRTIEPSSLEYLEAPQPVTRNEVDTTNDNGDCVCLNLETLKCFEVVERQYEEFGVIFNNCIAIQPSNPAFPTDNAVVLMGAPKGGFLEVAFTRPVNIVKALVTSSQRLLLSAYNRERKIVAQAVLPVGNLANSDSTLLPNALMSVKASQIYSITFCAFDGQFTVDNFSFCS